MAGGRLQEEEEMLTEQGNEVEEDEDMVQEDEGEEEDDEEKDTNDVADEDDSTLQNCSVAIKSFLTQRLQQAYRTFGGDESSGQLDDWKISIIKRTSGLTQGLLDFSYGSSKSKKKFRNRAELLGHLGLAPAIKKNIRVMSKPQFYQGALEYREKLLLSQLLPCVDLTASSIKYEKDMIILDNNINNSKLTDSCFAMGNITVLEWGKIINHDMFHNSHSIFPLGWKCIRQEHDQLSDVIVDCLCEVDALCKISIPSNTENDAEQEEKEGVVGPLTKLYSKLKEEGLTEVKMEDIIEPVFRITIEWLLPDNKSIVKVYEGKNIATVWQAAMLETVSVNTKLSTATSTQPEFDASSGVDEEMYLRNLLKEKRRAYMRALKAEQTKGTQEAMRPRLVIDNLETFFDDNIMRMIEGMDGALVCTKYAFYDSRDKEAGTKHIWKEYNRMINKMKALEKIYKKSLQREEEQKQLNLIKRNSNNTHNTHHQGHSSHSHNNNSNYDYYNSSHNNQHSNHQGNNIYNINAILNNSYGSHSGKHSNNNHGYGHSNNGYNKPLSDREWKEYREQFQAIQKLRTMRIRDVEKNIGVLKLNVDRTIRKRREEIKSYLESVASIEEQKRLSKRLAHSKNSSSAAASFTSSAASAAAIDVNMDIGSNQETPAVSSALPLPEYNWVQYDQEYFAYVLEVWSFLRLFCNTPCSTSAMTLEDFIKALRTVHVDSQRISSIVTGMKRKSLFGCLQLFPDLVDDHASNYHFSNSSHDQNTLDNASYYLNMIGVELTRRLLPDFEKYLGLDTVEAQTGKLHLPVNIATWKEIARISMYGYLYKTINNINNNNPHANANNANTINPTNITTNTTSVTNTSNNAITSTASNNIVTNIHNINILNDFAGIIKGRGFYTSPETADKKALKLCKKRILYAYQVVHETQESIYGFTAGFNVKLTLPSNPVAWSDMCVAVLRLIQQFVHLTNDNDVTSDGSDNDIASIMNDKCWLCIEVVKLIIVCWMTEQYESKDTKSNEVIDDSTCTMSDSMIDILSGSVENVLHTAVKDILTYFFEAMNTTNTDNNNTSSGVKNVNNQEYIQDVLHTIRGMIMTNDTLQQYIQMFINDSSSSPSTTATTATTDGLFSQTLYDLLKKQLNNSKPIAIITNTSALPTTTTTNIEDTDMNMEDKEEPQTTATATETAQEDIPMTTETAMDVVPTDQDTSTTDAVSDTNNNSNVNSSPSKAIKLSKTTTPIATATHLLEEEDDLPEAEQLTIAMQRCYFVIRQLMEHPMSPAFNYPVDRAQYPNYYNTIQHPLSLSEIRVNILQKRYEMSISSFYQDVIFLFENSLIYNLENSTLRTSAYKLITIFERLFYEMVLCYDNPLPYMDSCIVCRSIDPVSDSTTKKESNNTTSAATSAATAGGVGASKAACCDRCEAYYHCACLDPPLTTPPRAEWLCPACIEEKHVASAHPLRTARVRHPTRTASSAASSGVVGEVVGFEQVQDTAMFVIDFKFARERWTGHQLRKYLLLEPSDALDNTTDPTCENCYPLPSGYTYEDYDRVSGIVRAYAGWNNSKLLLPATIMNNFNRLAANITQQNQLTTTNSSTQTSTSNNSDIDHFLLIREAVAYLNNTNSSTSTSAWSAHEYITVFRALLWHQLKIYHNNTSIGATDTTTTAGSATSTTSTKQTGNANSTGISSMIPSSEEIEQIINSLQEKIKVLDDIENAIIQKTNQTSNTSANNTSINTTECITIKEEKETNNTSNENGFVAKEEDFEDLYSTTNSVQSDSDTSDSDSSSDEDNNNDDIFSLDNTTTATTTNHHSNPSNTNNERNERHWETRYLSRQKGREDALITQTLVDELVQSVNLDFNLKEEGLPENIRIDEELGPFYNTVVNNVVKSCIKRPGENLLVNQWIRGWQSKMNYILANNAATAANDAKNVSKVTPVKKNTVKDEEDDSDDDDDDDEEEEDKDEMDTTETPSTTTAASKMVCQYCGQDESYLCSPFVWGQTLEEWERDFGEVQDYNSNANNDDNDDTAGPTNINSKSNNNVSTTTGVKGFRARNKLLKGIVWCPVFPGDARAEARDCSKYNKVLIKGSSIVHECCAHLLHFNRLLSNKKIRHTDEQKILEVVLSQGYGNLISVGADRYHHQYYIFPHCTYIFIQMKSNHENINMNNVGNKVLNGSNWLVYSHESDIERLVQWLDSSHNRERLLKRAILMLNTIATSYAASKTNPSQAPSAVSHNVPTSTVITSNLPQYLETLLANYPTPDQSSSTVQLNDPKQVISQIMDSLGITSTQSDITVKISSMSPLEQMAVTQRRNALNQQTQETSSITTGSNVVTWHENMNVLHPSPTNQVKINNKLLSMWNAKVVHPITLNDTDKTIVAYKVTFDDFPSTLHGAYVHPYQVLNNDNNEIDQLSSLFKQAQHQQVTIPPHVLTTLQAYQHVHLPHRACNIRPTFSYANIHASCNSLDLLKAAMFLIEAALPAGAIDDSSEDRWADNFTVQWREAVNSSVDAGQLMQCQLLLEYGIRTQWLKPAGLKLFSCLPSRIQSLRTATYGSVAIRLFTLDMTIKYDKVADVAGAGQQSASGKKGGSKSTASSSAASTAVTSEPASKKRRK